MYHRVVMRVDLSFLLSPSLSLHTPATSHLGQIPTEHTNLTILNPGDLILASQTMKGIYTGPILQDKIAVDLWSGCCKHKVYVSTFGADVKRSISALWSYLLQP